MTTLIISGNHGLEDIDVSGYNLYDARQLTCNVWQGVKNTGANIDPSSPENAEFLGGRISGINDNKTAAWRLLYDLSNGAARVARLDPDRFYRLANPHRSGLNHGTCRTLEPNLPAAPWGDFGGEAGQPQPLRARSWSRTTSAVAWGPRAVLLRLSRDS